MGLGLEPQSDHLKNFTTYWKKRIKKRINAITLTVGNIRKTVNSQKEFFFSNRTKGRKLNVSRICPIKFFPGSDLATKLFAWKFSWFFWHNSSLPVFFLNDSFIYVTRYIIWFMSLPFHVVSRFFFPGHPGGRGKYKTFHPWSNSPPSCIYDYMLPLMGNTSIALCTCTA